MKAIGVIGYHHTGKTTVATTLITALTARGYRVASVKDIHNQDYHVDTAGTNTWKHTQAGSVAVFAHGLYESALLFPKPLDLKAVLPLLDCDFLVIEGMRNLPVPKILCAADETQLEELFDDTVIALSGIIATQVKGWEEPPVFDALTQADALVSFVMQKTFDLLPLADPDCCTACGLSCYDMTVAILKGERLRSGCHSDHPLTLKLTIDGKVIPLVPFVQTALANTIKGFVSSLRNADPNGLIHIEVKKP